MQNLLPLIHIASRRPQPLPIALWMRRAATRRALALLEARLLADIGLDEAGRRQECAKWFWQG